MSISESGGLLCDALYTQVFQLEIIRRMAESRQIALDGSSILFAANETVKKYVNSHAEMKSRVLPVDDDNTSVGYDNLFFLKIYRHVDVGINPDVEITRYLTEQVQFRQVPALLGSITWKFQKESIELGILQTLVEYHGNGRTYMY